MKTSILLLLAFAVVMLGIVGFAYSGLYNVSASSPHSGLVSWFLSTTSHVSVERRAAGIIAPDFGDGTLIRAGASDFAAMCAGCHGAPGQERSAMAQGLNPQAPDLAESAVHMTPAELFWVTKNGIKLTGMPAWGTTHLDAALWPVVAFMTGLPELDSAGYQELLAVVESSKPHDHSTHAHGDAARAM